MDWFDLKHVAKAYEKEHKLFWLMIYSFFPLLSSKHNGVCSIKNTAQWNPQ